MAVTGRYLSIPGLIAGEDLRLKQYYCVKLSSTAGEVLLATAAKDQTNIGLLQNDPSTGEVADVAFLGVAKGITEDTAVTFGSALEANTSGELHDASNDEAKIIGHALETSITTGNIISVLVNPSWFGTA